MTVSIIWNRWVQDGSMERHNGSQWPPITSSREDGHVSRLTLMNPATTSQGMSEEWETFARQHVSAGRRFLQQGHSAWRPWLRLHLKLYHKQERLKRCDQRRIWTHEWKDVVFSDESRFC
ncbi:HTH_Tnp_Tc3_2 domain-containing protein [Trichonephila clavipes]|uniref:HTH_Tnp_Tc3_2 domain-containing protein n=1 Tax=Trichonephila clavipes TaxID=2585209 RepID=A0A8X6WKN7_TRICX|nr:HTH_Tnp_Tc3_2 domain-containing protein [Trichonephila clavipes]